MPRILIIGATGKQGQAVITQLLAHQSPVAPLTLQALTRNPTSPTATHLASLGVELIQGSLENVSSLEQALEGIDAAFLSLADGRQELAQGLAFIKVASEVKLPFLVYSSAEGSQEGKGTAILESKGVIEEKLKDSGIPHVVLRPVFFYENIPKKAGIKRWMTLGLFDSILRGQQLPMVAVNDIGSSAPSFASLASLANHSSRAGWFAAQALLHPQRYVGRIIILVGDNLSMSSVLAVISRSQGSSASMAPRWFASLFLPFFPKDAKQLFEVITDA